MHPGNISSFTLTGAMLMKSCTRTTSIMLGVGNSFPTYSQKKVATRNRSPWMVSLSFRRLAQRYGTKGPVMLVSLFPLLFIESLPQFRTGSRKNCYYCEQSAVVSCITVRRRKAPPHYGHESRSRATDHSILLFRITVCFAWNTVCRVLFAREQIN
jgi:glycerol-3-phosphate dehydrogenase